MKLNLNIFLALVLFLVAGCTHFVDVSKDQIYKIKIGKTYQTREKLILHHDIESHGYKMPNLNIKLSEPWYIEAIRAEHAVIWRVPKGTSYKVVNITHVFNIGEDTDMLIGEIDNPNTRQAVKFYYRLGSRTLSNPEENFP